MFIHALTEDQVRQLHALYQGEWWSRGRTMEEVQRMLAGGGRVFGICEGENENGDLLAFARVITDGVFKALLFDVIVHPDHRGKGLGRALLHHVLEHPEIRQVRHVELYCLPERAGYYQEFGFSDEVQKELVLMRKTNQEGSP